MNCLLVALLTVMTGIMLWKERGNVLAPRVLVTLMFFLSSCFFAINYSRWEYEIRFNTVAVIFGGLFLFWIGFYLSEKYTKRFAINNPTFLQRSCTGNADYLEIPNKWFVVIVAICLLVTAAYVRHQYQLGRSLGFQGSIFSMLRLLRVAIVNDPKLGQLGTMMNLAISFTRAVGTVCLFIAIQHLLAKKRDVWKYMIPVALSLFRSLMTGGRASMISLASSVIFAVYYVLCTTGGENKDAWRKNMRKVYRYIFVAAGLFVLAFWGFGILLGKAAALNFWDTLSVYIGSPILCFDALLNGDIVLESNWFAQSTFPGLYNILRRVFPAIPTTAIHAEKVRWMTFSSNVYTSFFPYYMDFGVPGLFIMELIVGFVIGIGWWFFNNYRKKNTFIIYYGGTLGYACAMFSIAERLCSNFLALNVFIEWFFAIIIVRFLCRVRPKRNTD